MSRILSDTETIVIENIKRLLKDTQLSQAKLAALAGIPNITLSQVLNNRMVMRVDHVHRIAEAFGLPPYQLLMKNLSEEIPKLIDRLRSTPGTREQAMTDVLSALTAYVKEGPSAERHSIFKLSREEPKGRGIVQVFQTHVRDKAVIHNFCIHAKKSKKVVGIKIYPLMTGLAKIAQEGKHPTLLAEYQYNRTSRKGQFKYYGPQKSLLAAQALSQNPIRPKRK